MSDRLTNFLAAALLIFIFVIGVLSLKDDSLTMDELAHLPAGYSYLTQKDMRLNPEHPPLIKDLAALPLLFLGKINFPGQEPSWRDDVNGQWVFGNKFLFWSGNPAEKMIFFSRIPMVFVLLLLGVFVFRWAKELAGPGASLLALFLFSFSPTLLAHGRLVTTDVGAALGVTLATYYFLKIFPKSVQNDLPENSHDRGNFGGSVLAAGLALGFALLTKFSTILLLPFFGLILLVWILVRATNWRDLTKIILVYGLKFMVVLLVAAAVIWLVYLYHLWNYPVERQARDAEFILSSNPFLVLRQLIPALAENPILRPLGQYLLGLVMVIQRGAAGNTTYFLGEVSASGWKNYFPIVYLIKEPLSFHLLTLVAFLIGLSAIRTALGRGFLSEFRKKLSHHFSELALALFVLIYWLTTLAGNLNIGVRHLLPVFPLSIMLLARLTFSWLKPPFLKPKLLLLAALLAWQAFSVLSVFPSFLAYFNELAGGPDGGYVYVVDSNLDWGQDLKRLNFWLEKNKIDKIYVDYFGGSDTRYYLGEKYLAWQSSRDKSEMSESPYLAVSATLLQGQRGQPAPGFREPTGQYRWLDQYPPLAKIGYSIFVYKTRP